MNTIYVTTSFQGFHCWPDAPEQVAFLRSKHRHIFNVRLEVEVKHGDRDVEFFMLKEELDNFLDKEIEKDLGPCSCEQLASSIIAYFEKQRYSVYSCEVNEDNENGAIIRRRI